MTHSPPLDHAPQAAQATRCGDSALNWLAAPAGAAPKPIEPEDAPTEFTVTVLS
jgi:hypothetical protein